MPRSDGQFKKGQSGNPKGKKLGQRNKLNSAVWEVAESHKCNPLDVLFMFATDNLYDSTGKIKMMVKPMLRLEAAIKLSDFFYPKRKSIEVQNDSKKPLMFTLNIEKNKNPEKHK